MSATTQLPVWMPQESGEYTQQLEAKKAQEKIRPSLRDKFSSIIYASMIKRIWQMMPFFMLHMLSCSYSEISSVELVKTSSESNFGPITNHMKKIDALLKLGMEMSRTCEVIRREVKSLYLRDFFQRFAQVARLGEDMPTFLTKEYNTLMVIYASTMERSLTRLKRFSEAYSAILSSSVVILVITVFSGIIWGGGMELMAYMFPSMLLCYLIFTYSFYYYSPTIRIISTGATESRIADLMRIDRPVAMGTVVANLAFVTLLTLHILPREIGLVMAGLTGIPALVLGRMGLRRADKIQVLDERFPEFNSMLSVSLSTLDASTTYAFKDISKMDFGKLTPFIKRMQTRLELGLSPKTSWQSFRQEISSELIRDHTETYERAIALGAPARDVGPLVSNSSLFVLTERRRVGEVAALLKGIVTPMHPILCAIMGLIMAIIELFITVFQGYQGLNLPIVFLVMPPLQMIEAYFYVYMGAMTIVNAFIIHQVVGQTEFSFMSEIGLLTLTGWIAYYLSMTVLSTYLQGLVSGSLLPKVGG